MDVPFLLAKLLPPGVDLQQIGQQMKTVGEAISRTDQRTGEHAQVLERLEAAVTTLQRDVGAILRHLEGVRNG